MKGAQHRAVSADDRRIGETHQPHRRTAVRRVAVLDTVAGEDHVLRIGRHVAAVDVAALLAINQLRRLAIDRIAPELRPAVPLLSRRPPREDRAIRVRKPVGRAAVDLVHRCRLAAFDVHPANAPTLAKRVRNADDRPAVGRPHRLLKEALARERTDRRAGPDVNQAESLRREAEEPARIGAPAGPRELAVAAERLRIRPVALRKEQHALRAVVVVIEGLRARDPSVQQPRAVRREPRQPLVPLRCPREVPLRRSVRPADEEVEIARLRPRRKGDPSPALHLGTQGGHIGIRGPDDHARQQGCQKRTTPHDPHYIPSNRPDRRVPAAPGR